MYSTSSLEEGAMLKIQVLGPGCANCQKLEALARQAAAGLGVEAEVEKVSDMREIVARGVMATPGLAVNDRLVSTGRVPSVSEVMTLIANVLAQDNAAS
jgi:small redox-active disulfide protein 2